MVSEINGTQIDPSRTLGKATAFAQREQERLRRKHARYEEIGRAREAFAKRNRYYGGQVQLLVKTLVMPGTRVLEVGCGLGDLIADLRGSKVCGIDFSAEAIRIARRRHPELDLQVLASRAPDVVVSRCELPPPRSRSRIPLTRGGLR